MVDAAEQNRTIEFDNLSSHPQSEGDLTAEDIRRSIEESLQALRSELQDLQSRGTELLTEMGQAAPEDKARLLQEWKANSAHKQQTMHRISALEQRLNAHIKAPEISTALHNIQNAAGDKANTKLEVDSEGNLRLAVEHLQPTPFSFRISDGHLTFDNTNISKDQLKEMLGTLEKMGIKNIRLPEGLDAALADTLTQAMDERRQDEDSRYSRDGNTPVSMSGEEEPEFPVRPDEAQSLNMPEPKEPPKFSYDYNEFKHKLEFDILQRNMGKREGLSFFHTKSNGYDKWYVYDTENPDNFDTDGAVAKDGSVKNKNAFVIWSKEKSDGSLELGYSMPAGKGIGNALADKLISLHKDRGYTHIKFGDLTDDDAGTFRTRCARLGIIPVGIGINEKHAADMVKEAAGKLSETELQTFKWRLAQQMRANLRNQGKSVSGDRTEDYINELEGNYHFTPFKKAYDGVLKKMIEDESKSRKAEDAIGAVNAFEKVFEAYRGGSDLDNPSKITLGAALNPENNLFTEEEIAAIKARFAEKGKVIDGEQTMNKLSKEDLGDMFQAILPIQKKETIKNLTARVNEYDNKKDKDDTVKDEIVQANQTMSNIFEIMDSKGISKMSFSKISNTLRFGGNQAQSQQQQQSHNPQSYGRGDGGR